MKISFKNSSPDLAFSVVSIVSELFIAESNLNKKTDSYSAYSFIEKQVLEYQEKLESITRNINEFKSKNIGLQLDTEQNVNARLSEMKEQIKNTAVQLREAIIFRDSLVEQVEREKKILIEQNMIASAKSEYIEEDALNNKRLNDLEDKLNILRLSYTESYPDIVQIKEQIRILKDNLEKSSSRQVDSAETLVSEAGPGVKDLALNSPLYQSLQQELSTVLANIKILSTRKADLDRQFSHELARSREVNKAFYRLEELSRDYDATKSLYDKLLVKREDARVSLNLENEKAGSVYKVQEPPTIPLVPEGLRFLHFALGSMMLGVGLPLVAIVGLLMIDPRIRHEDDLGLAEDIPVIGVIPIFRTRRDLKRQRAINIQSVSIFGVALILWIVLVLTRYYEITLPFSQYYELLLTKIRIL